MTDVLCNIQELSNKCTSSTQHATEDCCTIHTLQLLVQAISSSSNICVNSLSSTALHNLLVLIEQNLNTLLASSLEEFVAIIEQSQLVVKDDWCRFLIGCLKQRMGSSQSCPLVRLEESSPIESASLVEDDMSVLVEPPNTKTDEEVVATVSDSSVGSDGNEPMEGVVLGEGVNEEEVIEPEASLSQNEPSSLLATGVGQRKDIAL